MSNRGRARALLAGILACILGFKLSHYYDLYFMRSPLCVCECERVCVCVSVSVSVCMVCSSRQRQRSPGHVLLVLHVLLLLRVVSQALDKAFYSSFLFALIRCFFFLTLFVVVPLLPLLLRRLLLVLLLCCCCCESFVGEMCVSASVGCQALGSTISGFNMRTAFLGLCPHYPLRSPSWVQFTHVRELVPVHHPCGSLGILLTFVSPFGLVDTSHGQRMN